MAQTTYSASHLHEVLTQALPGAAVSVRDDTHLHAGHNEAVGHHGGHYKVKLVWAGFTGLNRLARHRLVHQRLTQSWQAGHIHALSLQCLTPEEAGA